MDDYSFTDPGRMKGWVSLVWLTHGEQFSHKVSILSTIDRAQVRQSPPAKDRRPNYW